jgi:hypothetical protein
MVAEFSNYANGSPNNPQTGTAWALTAADYAALAHISMTFDIMFNVECPLLVFSLHSIQISAIIIQHSRGG